jgi:energy-coupling factor transporter ATP-binding protein EcfA2
MLQKLEINAIRGATKPISLKFEKGKKITILYGENGTGKSTICDSFELLAYGILSSLDGRGLGKTGTFWHSSGKKATDMSVALTTTKGTCKATLTKAKIFIEPDDARPQIAILRKHQILQLIAAQPKSRYDAISPFIDVSLVEKSEAALRKSIGDENQNRITAAARIEENRDAVENFWKQAGTTATNPLAWARAETAKDSKQIDREIELLEKIDKAIDRCNSMQQQLDTLITGAETKKNAVTTAAQRLQEEQQNASAEENELIPMLEAAKSFFHAHPANERCPLCGSTEFATDLPVKITEKLAAVKSLVTALRDHATVENNYQAAIGLIAPQRQRYCEEVIKLAALIQTEQLPTLLMLPKDLPIISADLSDSESAAGRSREYCTQLRDFSTKLKADLKRRQERKGVLAALKGALATYDRNFAAQKEIDQLLPLMQQALQEIEDERRRFIDAILGSIATTVGKYYERIHPGEGLSKISLLLDPEKRASLEILGEFPGNKGVPPGAYFSDSHLDSLGLCIFLALTQLRDKANTILILDDVVASADEPHVERIIQLLYSIAAEFRHCILTTHYRPWREKYRWGWLRDGQCAFVELRNWDYSGGIKQGNALPPIEELRTLLSKAQPSPQLACASAGVILEAILDFLTLRYECRVPRKQGGLTLGELLPSVKGKLRASLKIEQLEKDASGNTQYKSYMIGPLLDELETIAQTRNVFGCHFNNLAQNLPEADAIRFSKTVLQLSDYLVDIEYGWPGSNKSGSYWANAKETRRLHPLMRPS